jgi:hypothetical protein
LLCNLEIALQMTLNGKNLQSFLKNSIEFTIVIIIKLNEIVNCDY